MIRNNLSLSVIIACTNGLPIIEKCLESLHQQLVKKEVEVVVANRCKNVVNQHLRKRYTWMKLIDAPPQTSIPKLRAMAFRETTGDVVAVLEDHCIAQKDWAQSMIDAHHSENPVIGGSVENAACDRLVDWAAFFCEYSQAMKPLPIGEVNFLPGNNVSYKRWVLERFRSDMEAGVWDFVLHERIKGSHFPLYSIPSITVYHKMSASLSWFMVQKFHFARSFAGVRFDSSLLAHRALYAVGTVILPFIQLGRIISCVWKKKKHRQELFQSLPILMLLLLIWGIGEAVGYIYGPGPSPYRVA